MMKTTNSKIIFFQLTSTNIQQQQQKEQNPTTKINRLEVIN